MPYPLLMVECVGNVSENGSVSRWKLKMEGKLGRSRIVGLGMECARTLALTNEVPMVEPRTLNNLHRLHDCWKCDYKHNSLHGTERHTRLTHTV